LLGVCKLSSVATCGSPDPHGSQELIKGFDEIVGDLAFRFEALNYRWPKALGTLEKVLQSSIK
jgi:hypothetical protein